MIDNQNYLAHHGIQGMKWGIRRFQNEDGTLTPEGRERYHKGEGDSIGDRILAKAKSTGQKAIAVVKKKAKEKKDSYVARHKKPSSMTDEELRAKFNRLNMERSLKQIQNDLNGKGQKKSFAQKHPIIQQVAVTTAVGVASGLVTKQLNAKADEWLAPKRMERAKEKGMLNKDLFPFVYNNGARITSYNLNQDAKAKAAAEAKKSAEEAAKNAVKTNGGYYLYRNHPHYNKAKVAWDATKDSFTTMKVKDLYPKAGQKFTLKRASRG